MIVDRNGVACAVVVFALFAASCGRKEAVSPTKDFLTCHIDGMLWEAKVLDPSVEFATMYLGQNMCMLSGMSSANESVSFVLRDTADDNNSSGTFRLKYSGTSDWKNYGAYFDHKNNLSYYTDSVTPGTVIMTVNKTTRRVAGTFSYHAFCHDTLTGTTRQVHITEGKFACPYKEVQ